MGKELENAKKAIMSGKNPLEETFKIGFMACIEAIEDKGFSELAILLRKEHSQI